MIRMPHDNAHPQSPDPPPIERPLRWFELWRVFVPLLPWVAMALLIGGIVRLMR